jgi:hypothetical protein
MSGAIASVLRSDVGRLELSRDAAAGVAAVHAAGFVLRDIHPGMSLQTCVEVWAAASVLRLQQQ